MNIKKFIWVFISVAIFSLSTHSIYAYELKAQKYLSSSYQYEKEQELKLGFNTGHETCDILAWSLAGAGLAVLGVGLGLGFGTEWDAVSVTMAAIGGALIIGGVASWGIGSVVSYAQAPNENGFIFAQISAVQEDDFKWAPFAAPDLEGNMNYGAVAAYRF